MTIRFSVAGLAALAFPLLAHSQEVQPLIPVGSAPAGITINVATNKIYVANDASNSVSVIDGRTHAVTATIPAGGGPAFVATNPETNRIYVSNISGATVMAVNGATDTVSTTMLSGGAGWIATNPLTDKAYVLRFGAGDEVNIHQGEAYLLTSATRAYEPISLAVNPVNNMLYIIHRTTGDLVALDMSIDQSYPPRVCPDGAGGIRPFDPHEVDPPNCINIPDVPVAVAVNPVTSKVYAVSSLASDQISVVNGPAMASPHAFVTLTPPGVTGEGRAVAVNPVTNKVYFAFARHVVVLDGATNAMTVIPAGSDAGGPVAIGINVRTNRIFVPRSDGSLAIIDGASNAVTNVTIPAGARAIAVNPLTNFAYVLTDAGVVPVRDGVDTPAPNPITVNVSDPGSTLADGTGTVRIDVSNAFSPAPLNATRRVYYQVDGIGGPWQLATGTGPYFAQVSGLSTGQHAIYVYATNGLDSQSINTHPQDNPIVSEMAFFPFTVSNAASTTQLVAAANPTILGSTATFTATVSGSFGTPTGGVLFRADGNTIAGCENVPLSQGTATCNVSSLAFGAHGIEARYGGSGVYEPSASAVLSHGVVMPVDQRRTAFDGNGTTDLAWRNADGTHSLFAMQGLSFTVSAATAGAGLQLAGLGDLDGNASTDLLWRGTDGRFVLQLMAGSTTISTTEILPGGTGWEAVEKGDFNGDGRHDILWRHATSGAYGVWLMNGATPISSGAVASPGAGWSIALVGDFDGDGKSDLLWRHGDGRVTLSIMDGHSAVATASMLGAGTGWSPTFTADLNGDGKTDLLWRHQNGSYGLWLMNGTTITQYATLLGANTGWTATLAGDFNGDGKSDIVLEHTNGTQGVWLMDGANRLAYGVYSGAGTGWRIIAAGDYDGNGKADLLWRHADGRHRVSLVDGISLLDTAILDAAAGATLVK